MNILICQTCGSISASNETKCSNCGTALTEDSAFVVTPIQGSKPASPHFSFFQDSLTQEDATNDPGVYDDLPAEDLYVLSRPSISSALSNSNSNSAAAKSNTPGCADAQNEPKSDGRHESPSEKQNIGKVRTEYLKETKRFTNKDLLAVTLLSLLVVLGCTAVMWLHDGPQVKITFYNPLDELWQWFLQLNMAMKFMVGAVTTAAFGFVSLFVSFSLFSPNGKLNVWEKQKYIPSQFRKQHLQELNLLNKSLQPGGLPLGVRKEWKFWRPLEARNLVLTPELRDANPHVLIAGTGDTGKSRLMANMVIHDIKSADRAVVVVDSDGNLTDLITRWIAAQPNREHLAERVTLLEPTSKGASIGYNPLEFPPDGDLQSAAAAVVYGFKALYMEPPNSQSQWTQQTANILRSAAMLLMVNGRTLVDLPVLLNDSDFRDVLLETVEKRRFERSEFTTLLETWGNYKRLARGDQWISWVEPILNRVTPMLGDDRIRSILTKPVSDLKLENVIKDRRILIVKIQRGKFDQHANLLGSLIVTGVKQAALSLSETTSCEQPPVALYLDELDNFIEKETFNSITLDSEELKIGFIGSIKTLQHLPEDFRSQLTIGVKTMCCFTLTKKDADSLGPQIFRVDGRKPKNRTIQNWINQVNTSPQFELISDEEKLNIDRLLAQDTRSFFCYRVGTAAGVFCLKAPNVKDFPMTEVVKGLVAQMRRNV